MQGLARPGHNGMARLTACRDGTVTLHLTCAGTQVGARLDISRAAQLSTGIWEAAGVSQQLIERLGEDWSPPPQLPTRFGQPTSSLVSAPPTEAHRPRSTAPGHRRGTDLGE